MSVNTLLQEQLADLERLRQVVAAQRAVLQMEDLDLLQAFSREAVSIADAVLARETTLLALRLAAHREPVERPDPTLQSAVDQIRAQAGSESLQLARQMEREAQGLARELEAVGRRLDAALPANRGLRLAGEPMILDRNG